MTRYKPMATCILFLDSFLLSLWTINKVLFDSGYVLRPRNPAPSGNLDLRVYEMCVEKGGGEIVVFALSFSPLLPVRIIVHQRTA